MLENSPAGTRLGAPIRATDTDGDTLLYHADSDAFEIDPATGQLTTRAGVTYDYETRARYEFDVEVIDGENWDVVAVTVNLTDVAEAGTPNDGTPGGLPEEVEATPERPATTTWER